jgi:hypothetical protein
MTNGFKPPQPHSVSLCLLQIASSWTSCNQRTDRNTCRFNIPPYEAYRATTTCSWCSLRRSSASEPLTTKTCVCVYEFPSPVYVCRRVRKPHAIVWENSGSVCVGSGGAAQPPDPPNQDGLSTAPSCLSAEDILRIGSAQSLHCASSTQALPVHADYPA